MMNNQERLTIATAILNKFKKGEQLNIENSPIDKLVFSLDPSFDLIKILLIITIV
jgi:hypothetical protein